MEVAIIGLACLFFAGHALQWFFIKTKIPDLLILTIIGYLLGPVFGWITPEDLGQVGNFVSTLALIVILYEAGLHLPTKELKAAWFPSLLMSLISFISVTLVTLAIVQAVVPFPHSFLVALAVGSTSSAIVIPMVKILSLSPKTKIILSLESAFTDIFAIVLFLVAIEAFQNGFLDLGSLAFNVGPKTLLSMGFGIGASFLWAIVKKYFPEYTFMPFAGESWALLTYGLCTVCGLNGAMAVLSLGFALANLNLLPRFLKRYCSIEPVSFEEMSLLKEITFLLKTFFFLYLGTLVSFQSGSLVFLAVLIALGIYFTRFLCVWALFRPGKTSLMDALSVVSMGPRGLACAVLATLPMQKGLPYGETIRDILFAVIPLTILMTALLIFLCENKFLRPKLQFLFPFHDNTEEGTSKTGESNEIPHPSS